MLKAIPIRLTTEKETELKRALREYLDKSERGTKQLYDTDIPRFRRIYNGEPFEKVKNFPWHRASNFVVQLVAIHTDTLVARILSLIFKTDPLFTFKVFGDLPEDAKRDLEAFMQHAAMDESELDFYNCSQDWIFDVIKLGSSVMKVPYSTEREIIVEPGIQPGSAVERTVTKYDGPKPTKIPLTDWLMWPLGVRNIRDSLFKAHRVRLEKEVLEHRAWMGFYDMDKVKELLKRGPDNSSATVAEQQQENSAGIVTYGQNRYTLDECWLRYPLTEGRYYQIIGTYHKASDTIVRLIHNPYVTGDDIDNVFVGGRLFPRDDMWHGRGFAEVLELGQEEASTIHNQRRDNATIGNTKVFVVKKDSFVDISFPIFPGKPIIVDDPDDIRAESLGTPTTFPFEEERIALDLAERRSGVSPPMIGYGAGAMGGKRGVYTASGTLSMLQEGNMRTDMNIMDIRSAITRAARICLKSYHIGGVHEKLLEKFGPERSQRILQQIQNYPKLQMDLTASNASLNREVEKQTSTMLAQTMQQYYQQVIQLVQMMQQFQQTNPQMFQFLSSIYDGSRVLMHNILRSFESGDTERVLPKLPAPAVQQPGQMALGPQGGPPQALPTPGMGAPPPNPRLLGAEGTEGTGTIQ